MVDIFNHTVLCRNCVKAMKPALISKNGFNLRALRCEKCNEAIIHPADEKEYNEFINLKKKEYEVKMRMVGNSYAVSIPREIVDFMKEQERIMNNMVRLNFEEAGRLSLNFNTDENKSRVIKAREVKIIKNNKPVFHAKQFSDSANPKNNQTKIFKSEKIEED